MGHHNQPVRRRLVLILTLALALPPLLLTEQALAQPTKVEKREQAIAHYNQGEAYFKAGTFDRAVDEYKKAYALVPRAGLLFNIALAQENHGARAEAITSYARYLEAKPNGKKAAEARARLEALRRTQAQARASQATVEAHRTRADEFLAAGKHLDAIAELRSLNKLQPAPALLYQIGVAYENAGEAELAIAEYARYLETGHAAHAKDAASRRRALKATGEAGSEPSAGRLGEEMRPRGAGPTRARGSVALPLVASGVSAALLGTGIFLGLHAASLESELRAENDDVDPPIDASDPRFAEGRTANTVATSLFVVSAAAAAASGYLWWRYVKGTPAGGSKAAFLTPTSNGLALGGWF